MFKKIKTKRNFFYPMGIVLLGVIGFVFIFLNSVNAQVPLVRPALDVGLKQLSNTGLGIQDIRVTIAKIIRILLGFLGTLSLLIMLYAGYLIMTAGGNPEKVTKGKDWLRNGAIGLGIILSAFTIVSFVIGALQGAISGQGGFGGQRRGGSSGGLLAGSSIIESHYPTRGATDIPRNTKIFVTFREPIDVTSLIDDNGTPNNLADDRLKTDAVQIRKTIDSPSGPFVAGRAGFTPDFKTFVFAPNELLGTSVEKVDYTVVLTNSIKKKGGQPAFGISGGYDWHFEVGTFVDNTPPQIISVFPKPILPNETNPKKYPRNVMVQINFSEAMDPTTVVGSTVNNFTNVTVNTVNKELVEGAFNISNQYKTIEFVTTDLCGTNSCGGDVYCLPGAKNLVVVLTSATLDSTPPASVFPYDGIVDSVGNSLDGNGNGTAEGQGPDNYLFGFSTSNLIDLIPPTAVITDPAKQTGNIALDAVISSTFDKVMSFSSVNKGTVSISDVDKNPINYWVGGTTDDVANQSTIQIFHENFGENTQYFPEINSGLNDIYQNCYNPCVGP